MKEHKEPKSANAGLHPAPAAEYVSKPDHFLNWQLSQLEFNWRVLAHMGQLIENQTKLFSHPGAEH